MDFLGIKDQQVLKPGQATSCITGLPENMIINLSVDRDKAKVDANVNGKPVNNVRVNLSPNHPAQ
jgi:hypothetical protein